MNERANQPEERANVARCRAELAELDRIFKNSPVGLAVIDRDLRVVRVNDHMAEITKLPVEAHIGHKLGEIAPDIAERLERIFASIISTGEPVLDIEIAGVVPGTPNGEVQHWLASYFPLRTPNGQVTGVLAAVMEISELKRTQEALLLTQFTVDHAPEAVYWIKKDSHFVYVNEIASQMLGYSKKELLEMSVGDIDPIFPMDRWDEIWETDKAQGTVTFETLHRTRQGRDIPVEITTNFIEYAGDILNCAYARDITARKQGQEAIRELSMMMKLVLDTIPVSVWWKDRNGHYLGCNYLFVAKANLTSPEDIIGKTDFDMPWSREQSEKYRADDLEVIETGIPKLQYEERQQIVDGRTIWVRTNKVPLRDFEGNIIGVLGTFEDVTERKLAEQALQESSQMLRLILDTIPVPVWWKDANGMYLGCNRLNASFAGLSSPEEMIGKTDFDMPWKDTEAERYLADDLEVIESGLPKLNYEETLHSSDGSLIWLKTSKVPLLSVDGQIIGVLGTFEDITERKLAEGALYKANRTLAALSKVNEILVRATEESQLLREVCQAIVDVGGYRMAWVGYAMHDQQKSVKPVAYAGHMDGYLNQFPISWAEDRFPHTPAGDAIATGEVCIVPDVANEPLYEEWRNEAHKRGYGCSASFPVKSDGTVIGAISFYRPEPGCLDVEEQSLLSQLVSDLSYGITSLRAREARSAAAAERRALEQRLDEHKRKFYRETILSVTDGKLDICDYDEVEPYVTNSQIVIQVNHPMEVGQARRIIEEFCRRNGVDEDELSTLIVAIGEAMNNALKHADGGTVYAGRSPGEIWMAVADQGKGIESLILPRAVLRRGFSTKPSLGLGYSIILHAADRVLLSTGALGTTVVMVKSLQQATPSLDTIPDTWESVPAASS